MSSKNQTTKISRTVMLATLAVPLLFLVLIASFWVHSWYVDYANIKEAKSVVAYLESFYSANKSYPSTVEFQGVYGEKLNSSWDYRGSAPGEPRDQRSQYYVLRYPVLDMKNKSALGTPSTGVTGYTDTFLWDRATPAIVAKRETPERQATSIFLPTFPNRFQANP